MFDKQTLLSKPMKITPRKQTGAAAIEFALVFPLFFALFYAIVGYSLVMAIQQSMIQASKEGIRAGIKADPTHKDYLSNVETLARSAITQSLSGLPSGMRSHISTDVSIASSNITVTLSYPYSEHPILPVLSLPVIGDIPNIPGNFVIKSEGQL